MMGPTNTQLILVASKQRCGNTAVYLRSNEPGSSVSIVSGYGLDDQAIEIRYLAEARDFSSNLCVQTGCAAHPASCTMGTRAKVRLRPLI
jgi:hypothetical protein